MNLDQKNIIIFESKYQLDRYKASNPSFFEDLEVLTDLEILPYDNFSPDPSLLGKRIETLRSLIEDEVSLVCTASSIIQPLFDKKYIFEKTFEISKNHFYLFHLYCSEYLKLNSLNLMKKFHLKY